MSNPIHEPSATFEAAVDKKTPKRNALSFNLIVAILVWAMWLTFGGRYAIHHLFADWQVAITMVFGSLVGGGTSEGGGAIAFPIFTKLLHIAPRRRVQVRANLPQRFVRSDSDKESILFYETLIHDCDLLRCFSVRRVKATSGYDRNS